MTNPNHASRRANVLPEQITQQQASSLLAKASQSSDDYLPYISSLKLAGVDVFEEMAKAAKEFAGKKSGYTAQDKVEFWEKHLRLALDLAKFSSSKSKDTKPRALKVNDFTKSARDHLAAKAAKSLLPPPQT